MNYKRIMALTATTCFLLLAVAITASAQEPNVSLSDQMDYLIAPLGFYGSYIRTFVGPWV